MKNATCSIVQQLPVAQLLKWGRLYEEEGLINDAIDFYEKANSPESLENLLPLALQEGDAFIYARLIKALGRQAAADEWIRLGKRAAELGKDDFAREEIKRGGMETAEIVQSQKGSSLTGPGCLPRVASRPVFQGPFMLDKVDFVFTS